MNLIKFAQKTFEEGGAMFSIPLGEDHHEGIFEIQEDTMVTYKFTDNQSVSQHIRSYIYQEIDLLVDHDYYLCSRTSGDNLYLFISKLQP